MMVSIDSFFIANLVSGTAKANLVTVLFSPFFHLLFCYLGMLAQQSAGSLLGDHFLGVVVLIIIIAGAYLFLAYKPKKEIMQRASKGQDIKAGVIIVLLFFCSLDALAAGFVFGYWKTAIQESLVIIGGINLVMVLLPILATRFMQRSYTPGDVR